MELTLPIILTMVIVSILVGVSKTGIPSLGILNVMLLVLIVPAKDSIGLLLPMLIVGDIFAVIYYRRTVIWKHLIVLIPSVLIGILVGFLVLLAIDSPMLQRMIGILLLALVAVHFIKEYFAEKINDVLYKSKIFSWVLGSLAGFTTMIGNASGGIMAIYLLTKRLNRTEFVGTGAWFFLFVNLIKVPFYIYLGVINWQSLQINLWMIPTILLGCLIGIFILKRISETFFQHLVLFLATVGALRLIF